MIFFFFNFFLKKNIGLFRLSRFAPSPSHHAEICGEILRAAPSEIRGQMRSENKSEVTGEVAG